jgi:hypothetical protein
MKMLSIILEYYHKGSEAIAKGVPMVKLRSSPWYRTWPRCACPSPTMMQERSIGCS